MLDKETAKKKKKKKRRRKIDKAGKKDEMFDLTVLNVREHYKASYKTVREPDI